MRYKVNCLSTFYYNFKKNSISTIFLMVVVGRCFGMAFVKATCFLGVTHPLYMAILTYLVDINISHYCIVSFSFLPYSEARHPPVTRQSILLNSPSMPSLKRGKRGNGVGELFFVRQISTTTEQTNQHKYDAHVWQI